jgi:predicted DNA-binding transcriptional regulator AlpA
MKKRKEDESTSQSTKGDGDPLMASADTRRYLGGISEMTLWRWLQILDFPAPDMTLQRRRFWRRSTVEAWLAAQAEKAA